MARKYFQAKKTTNNPFALGKQYSKSQKHRFMVIALSVFIGLVLISSAISTVYRYVKGDQVVLPVDQKVAANTQDKPKRKAVKPIADEDFKGAKEYSFYTQLEERSLDLGGSDRFGGVALDDVQIIAPMIQLESMGGGSAHSEEKPNNVDLGSLVLESTHPSEQIDAIIKAKQPADDAKVVASSRTKHLQIGSFVSQSEAVNHRAKLEMYGFSPQIIRGKNNEDKTIYRVHLGPFSSAELPSIKERLKSLGISYFEIKQ